MDDSFNEHYKPEIFASSAEWVVDRCSGVPNHVLSTIMPSGFDRYVRIYHPGNRVDPLEPDDHEAWAGLKSGKSLQKVQHVRWRDVARENNRTPHRLMRWFGVCPYSKIELGQGGTYPPFEGELTLDIVGRLFNVLAQHTEPQQACTIGIWAGFGRMDTYADAARFEPSAGVQDLLLFSATFASVRGHWIHALESPDIAETAGFTPNCVWPTTRSWYLVVPHNLRCSYLGCDAETAQQILSLSGIETDEAFLSDDLWDDPKND